MYIEQNLKKVKINLKNGNYDAARSVLLEVFDKYPNNSRIQNELNAVDNIIVQKKINEISRLFEQEQYLDVKDKCLVLIDNYPENHILYNIAGAVHSRLHEFEKAEGFYIHALNLNPNCDKILSNLSETQNHLNKYELAESNCFKALKINPVSENALINLGITKLKTNNFREAINLFNECININPENILAKTNLANAYCKNLNYVDAIAIFKNIFHFIKNNPETLNLFAHALIENKNYDESLSILDFSKNLNSHVAETYKLLADNFFGIGDNLKAIEYLSIAISLDKENSSLYNYLGVLQAEEKIFDEALNSFNKSLSIDPNKPRTKFNKSLIYLRRGIFNNGWDLYEEGINYNIREINKLYFHEEKELWDGLSFDGTLLVYDEQGVGDQILFGTLLSDLIKIQSKVIMKIDQRLINLFSRTFKEIKFIPADQNVQSNLYEKYISIGSLPKYLRKSFYHFENSSFKGLRSDELKNKQIKNQFKLLNNLKIGLSWHSFGNKTGNLRSLKQRDVISLLNTGHSFINLQYGNIFDEIKAINFSSKNKLITIDGIDLKFDIDDVASIIDNCDLIITIDNTVAHLAGSLGKVAYLITSSNPENPWWLENRDDSIWYPNIKLFRQKIQNNWEDVIMNIKKSLMNFQKVKN